MKRSIRIAALLLLFPLAALHAQTVSSGKTAQDDTESKWRLYTGLSAGITASETKFAGAADFQLERYLSPKLALTFNAGFYHAFGREYHYQYGGTGTVLDGTDYYIRSGHNIIPLKAGLKYYVSPKFYVAAAAGIGIDINGNSYTLLSPMVGWQISKKLDLSVKYENYSHLNTGSQVAVRLAYRLF